MNRTEENALIGYPSIDKGVVKGTHFGASKKELPAEFDEIYSAWKEGKYSIREAAEKAGMNYSTFYRRS